MVSERRHSFGCRDSWKPTNDYGADDQADASAMADRRQVPRDTNGAARLLRSPYRLGSATLLVCDELERRGLPSGRASVRGKRTACLPGGAPVLSR